MTTRVRAGLTTNHSAVQESIFMRCMRTISSIAFVVALMLPWSNAEARVSAPSNVAATARSSSSIELTWTDTNTNVAGFLIERSVEPRRAFAAIATADGGTRRYVDTGLDSDTAYYYRLRTLQENRSSSGTLLSPRKSTRSLVANDTTLPAPGPSSAFNPTPTATPGGVGTGGGGSTGWSKRFGGSGTDIATTTAVDAQGNIIVAGRFTGSAAFGGATLTSAGGFDVFVAKYASDGTHLWSKRLGGSGQDLCNDVAVDDAGNVILAGSFEQSVNFGGGALTSAGGYDGFLAKYASNGAHVWSRRFGSSGQDSVNAVAANAGTGSIVAGGYFQGSVSFGGAPLTTAEDYLTGLVVASYAPDGTHLWSDDFESLGFATVRGVAVGPGGAIALTGYFQGSLDFGVGVMTSAPSDPDGFVAVLSALGEGSWSRRFGAVPVDYGNAVAVDAAGNVAIAGEFRGDTGFGGSVFHGDNAGEAFVAKYSPTGKHLWSLRIGAYGWRDSGEGLAFTPSGDVMLGGSFQESADFGGTTLVSRGDRDGFVALYRAADGHLLRAEQLGGNGSDVVNGIAIAPSGAAIATGYFTGAADLAGTTVQSAGGLDDFVHVLR